MSVFFQTMAFMCTKAINRPFRFGIMNAAFFPLFFHFFRLPYFCCSVFVDLSRNLKKRKIKKDFIRSGSNPLDVCVFLIPMAAGSDTQATLVN